jgi:glycosyltransferase involved in cell wall biosynthesis
VALAENVHRAGAGRVVPAEVEAWTEALVEALEPPSPAMRAAARNLAASAFSWRAIARDLQAEYVRILARS